ncbi:MAG: hypothetical protein IIC83_12835 [Chloroflexi bacterium]|nr:hypothetical protein [Chloroflexota bacterium]
MQEPTSLKNPIDVMYLIHIALRAEAANVERVAEELKEGGTLQNFKLAFNRWAAALVFHAEQEDLFISAPLTAKAADVGGNGRTAHSHSSFVDSSSSLADRVKAAMVAHEDRTHMELLEAIEDVLEILNSEIGKTSIITRTKQHLSRQVVTLRIVQEDHLETEEMLVMPLLRAKMSEADQLRAAGAMLLDPDADDPHWVLDWVSSALSQEHQRLLSQLEPRLIALQADVE